jgi:2,4-dienoyl-CoA reductase-like NADH-dependent reductase (Old Yellow Enzyme family)
MEAAQPVLFTPLKIRGAELPNRLVLAPMMQYRAFDGNINDWHLVHFGKFALGGFGVVMTEVVSVEATGRISYGDLGLWSDSQIEGMKRCTNFIHAEGSLAAVQLGHAGRKASTKRVWEGGGPLTDEDAARGEPSWEAAGPSPISQGDGYPVPRQLSIPEIREVVGKFADAARRAHLAGFDIIEIHGAHGYLISSFLSPVSNQRDDEYGGDIHGRMRFALEVVRAIRTEWPDDKPLFFRISAEDGAGANGWKLEDSVLLASLLHEAGVDVIDCSSGGIQGSATVQNSTRGLGYQVPYAERITKDLSIPTMAVGLILSPAQAEQILVEGKAQLIAIGRQALYDPFWPLHAKQALLSDPDFEGWNLSSGWWLRKRGTALTQLGFPHTGAQQ